MFEFKERYNIDDLLEIMAVLRSENGCEWDKVQTHESIRTDLIEEAYEVCEGIDSNDPEILREELGDLLLQIVFHTQIERENDNFNFDDVCNDICQKLVYRHPHVFGEVKVNGTEDILKNWDKLKQQSKNQDTYSDTLESVPKHFPALLRGEKIHKRASRAGLPVNDAKACADSIRRALDELESAGFNADNAQNQQIIGNMLLSASNLSRILKNDSEKALTYSTNRFIMLFRQLEESVQAEGRTLDDCTEEELLEKMNIVFSGL